MASRVRDMRLIRETRRRDVERAERQLHPPIALLRSDCYRAWVVASPNLLPRWQPGV